MGSPDLKPAQRQVLRITCSPQIRINSAAAGFRACLAHQTDSADVRMSRWSADRCEVTQAVPMRPIGHTSEQVKMFMLHRTSPRTVGQAQGYAQRLPVAQRWRLRSCRRSPALAMRQEHQLILSCRSRREGGAFALIYSLDQLSRRSKDFGRTIYSTSCHATRARRRRNPTRMQRYNVTTGEGKQPCAPERRCVASDGFRPPGTSQ